MGLPWYLKPDFFLHRDLVEEQAELSRSLRSSNYTDQRQDKEIDQLKQRIAELELQLLTLEKLLSEKGILPPQPAEPEPLPGQTPAPVRFPARDGGVITCPNCGRRQRDVRDSCYACQTPFLYENE